jgi:hypothetical protein
MSYGHQRRFSPGPVNSLGGPGKSEYNWVIPENIHTTWGWKFEVNPPTPNRFPNIYYQKQIFLPSPFGWQNDPSQTWLASAMLHIVLYFFFYIIRY